ncbi:PHD-finger [Musa troglodytarum]|uniref:PHD finger protein ALFIN-LIKE n=1 Tax=Musa troglodytarum TaxID=320322 RepID=A0A9E7L4P7_9LILI|nr:PHD-finger [Musa troglodytarum]
MIFRDFLGKRAGFIKALTAGPSFPLRFSWKFYLALLFLIPFPCSCCFTVTACFLLGGGAADYEKFHQQCDPQKPYMCLYGCPNETWELKEPPDVPHELPEPNIGN